MNVGVAAQIACMFEALARKAGNVHPDAAFADCSHVDFLLSALAIGPTFETAGSRGLGQTALAAVEATQKVTRVNTNLGIILLLAPLAQTNLQTGGSATNHVTQMRLGAAQAVNSSTLADAEAVYAAVRLCRPGGLGDAAEQDVKAAPTVTLREAMRLAAERDLVARQYVNGFADVFDLGLPPLAEAARPGTSLEESILTAQLRLLAALGDSLIARKLGSAAANEAKERAHAVLAAGWPASPESLERFRALDAWLRGDGHRRNPGAVADLVTAALFVAFRSGTLKLPLAGSWRFERLG